MTHRTFVVSTVALLVVLFLLVAALARLQWDWLRSIENYEHMRLEGTFGRHAWYLKQAFDDEIDGLAGCFRAPGGRREELATAFAGELRLWQQTARWPGLFAAAYLVSDTDLFLERFDPLGARFQPMAWPPELEPLRRRLAALDTEASPRPSSLRVVTEVPVLLLETWIQAGDGTLERAWVAIHLDEEHLHRRLLPELTALFFSPPAFDGVDIAVVESASQELLFSNLPIDSLDDFGRTDLAYGLVDAGTDGEELPSFGLRPRRGQEAIPNWPRPPTAMDHQWFQGLWARNFYSGYWHLHLRRGVSSVAEEVAAARRRAALTAFGALGLICVVVLLTILLARRAQRLARDQMEFVASVSHELRSPLAALSAAGDNLADSLFDDPSRFREYGRMIQDETQRLREMVENVLHLARRRSAAPLPVERPVDVNDLVDDTLRRSRRQIEQAGFEVEVAMPSEPPRVLGDARALQSALLNLISNALKYGLPARWLRVAVERGEEEVRISIEDRGAGIGKQELPRLFDPFYRGERARAGQIEGSGLGLAVARDVVERHGGRIVVDSTPGVGSRFTLHLPVEESG